MSTRHVSALNVLVLTLWRNLMMVSNFACIVTRGVDCTTLMLKCWFKLENIIVTCFFCKIGRKLNIGLTGWSILWCGIYWVATLFCQYMNVVFFLCSPLCICSHPDIHYQLLSNSKVVCPFSFSESGQFSILLPYALQSQISDVLDMNTIPKVKSLISTQCGCCDSREPARNSCGW